MKKLVEWIKVIFLEEFEVIIWYGDEPINPIVYKLKKIDKINSKILKGKGVDGLPVELVVQTPFNYQIKKTL